LNKTVETVSCLKYPLYPQNKFGGCSQQKTTKNILNHVGRVRPQP